MKIVIAALNSQYIHSSLAPWCLLAGLRAYVDMPLEAYVVEGTVNEPIEKVAERVNARQPDVLGICCYIWNIEASVRLAARVKTALPGCLVVLGGPEVGPRPDSALSMYADADYVISGEGEYPFAMLIKSLMTGSHIGEVPGLSRRDNGNIITSPPYVHDALPPSPYSPAYFKALNGRIAYLETSRGCPFSCAFCLSGGDPTVRYTPLDRVYQELLQLAASGATTIKLVDRTFNAHKSRSKSILRFLLEAEASGQLGQVCFHFEIAGDLLDDETMALVEQAPPGLFQFEIGLQSFNEQTLAAVNRKSDTGLIERHVRRLIASGRVHVHLDLIAGLPHEGLASFRHSFDRAFSLKPHALQLGFLKLIHGSAMRENRAAYPLCFQAEPPYTVLETPWLSRTDFQTLYDAERGLDRLYNSRRFLGTLDHIINAYNQSAFDVFQAAGQAIRSEEANNAMSLDQLTECFFRRLSDQYPQHMPVIRDLMLLDRMTSTPTTVLPACLKRKDARFFAVKRALKQKDPPTEGVARAISFLYAGDMDRVVYVDYHKKNPVTGLYPLKQASLPDLGL